MVGTERMTIGDRYVLYGRIAAGGMAAVHLGRTLGAAGFTRVVAIKRLHPHLLEQGEFRSMFIDEARLAARIRHPNVVQTLDIVATNGELFVVMEYVHGESLGRLLRAALSAEERVPIGIANAIATGLLHGLHAAHEARSEQGAPLEIVHRDVSPQNVLVGTDGLARVIDFGIAKAAVRLQATTRGGEIKGKIAYMAPEQLRSRPVTRRTDVYAASVVLWEMFTCRRLFQSDTDGGVLEQILTGMIDPPSKYAPELPAAIDDIVLRGLSSDPERRFESAKEMAEALQAATPPALPSELGAWVERMAGEPLHARAEEVSRVERDDTAASVEGRTPAPVMDEVNGSRWNARGRLASGAVAVAVLLLGGVAVFRMGEASRPTELALPASPGSEPSSAPTPDPVPLPATVPLPAPPPSSGGAEVAPPASPSPTARAASAPRSRPPSDDCAVPFTRNADGRKIYKRQCLR